MDRFKEAKPKVEWYIREVYLRVRVSVSVCVWERESVCVYKRERERCSLHICMYPIRMYVCKYVFMYVCIYLYYVCMYVYTYVLRPN